jgi:hypothetical protein
MSTRNAFASITLLELRQYEYKPRCSPWTCISHVTPTMHDEAAATMERVLVG